MYFVVFELLTEGGIGRLGVIDTVIPAEAGIQEYFHGDCNPFLCQRYLYAQMCGSE
jgi:hypothetical protein